MGLKSKSNAMNMPSKYTVEGLIFSSKDGYEDLKNIDANAQQLVDAIKAGSLNIKEFFSRFDKTKVKETHVEAAEYIELLFPNISNFISLNDPDYFKTELDFSDHFYSLMDIKYYED